MANRYWVGGSGTWDNTTTTNWSATSGGAGGASAPTSADNVFLDAASGAVTVTLSGGVSACADLTCTGFTGTLTGAVAFNVYGSLLFSAGMTVSTSVSVSFRATTTGKTITSNGKTIAPTVNFTGTGGWTLQDAFSCSTITHTQGALDTNGQAVSAGYSNAGTGTRSLTLGATVWTMSSNWSWSISGTGMTLSAGTSTIKLGNNPSTNAQFFEGNGYTYYNVEIPGTGNNVVTVSGNNTFNTFTISRTSAFTLKFTDGSTQTIANWVGSGTPGNFVTITNTASTTAATLAKSGGGTVTLDYSLISWITASPVSTWSATNSRNLGNNTNITFTSLPTRYWVGGTATWGLSNTANWSLSSGGASGASVPTANDNVVFDAASGAVTVSSTTSTILQAYDLTFTGFTGNFNLVTNSQVNTWGNATFSAGMGTASSGGHISFQGSSAKTLTTNGKSLGGNVIANGTGSVTLAGALTIAGTVQIGGGTFSTNNFNITAMAFQMLGTSTSVINLGSSIIMVTGGGTANVLTGTTTNTTLNAGTSLFVIPASVTMANITGGGATFYDIDVFMGSTGGVGVTAVSGFTCRNFRLVPTTGWLQFNLTGSAVTITGTFTSTGNTAQYKNYLSSNAATTTISAAAVSIQDTDFYGITGAGAAVPWAISAQRVGNGGGNSSITFPAAVNRYAVTAGNFSSTTTWAATSGGASGASVPLLHDATFYDLVSPAGTYNVDITRVGGITATGFTRTLSIVATAVSIYGSFILSSGMTFTPGNAILTFMGRDSTYSIDAQGKTFYYVAINPTATSTYSLASDLTCNTFFSVNSLAPVSCVFSTNNFNITSPSITLGGNSAPTTVINLGASTLTCSADGATFTFNGGATLNAGTSTILFSSTGTSARTFAGAGATYNNLVIGGTTGTSTLTLTGSNTFNTISSTKTVAHTVKFTAGTTTTISNFTVAGGGAGSVVTLTSTTTSPATLTKTGGGTITTNYANISNLTATPALTWFATNSIDVSGNTGWTFSTVSTGNSLLFGNNF